jgi:hypothetical protein
MRNFNFKDRRSAIMCSSVLSFWVTLSKNTVVLCLNNCAEEGS